MIVTSNTIGTISFTTPVVGLNSTYGERTNWTNQKRYKDALFVEATNPVTITQRILIRTIKKLLPPKGGMHWVLSFTWAHKPSLIQQFPAVMLGTRGCTTSA